MNIRYPIYEGVYRILTNILIIYGTYDRQSECPHLTETKVVFEIIPKIPF